MGLVMLLGSVWLLLGLLFFLRSMVVLGFLWLGLLLLGETCL